MGKMSFTMRYDTYAEAKEEAKYWKEKGYAVG